MMLCLVGRRRSHKPGASREEKKKKAREDVVSEIKKGEYSLDIERIESNCQLRGTRTPKKGELRQQMKRLELSSY